MTKTFRKYIRKISLNYFPTLNVHFSPFIALSVPHIILDYAFMHMVFLFFW